MEARNGAPKTQYCAAIGGGLAQILQKLKDLSFGHARNAWIVAVVLLLVVSPTNPQVPRRLYADGMATTTATLSL